MPALRRAASASSCQTSSVTNGNHRVQQPQQRVERVGQHPLGRRPLRPGRCSRALTIST